MDLTQSAQCIFTILFSFITVFFVPSRDDHLVKGDEYYESFENEKALKEYELAYQKSPTSYWTLFRLVRIHNDNGRVHLRKDTLSESEYRKALCYADSLLHYYPDSAGAHFWYALSKGSLIPFVGVGDKIAIGKDVKNHIQQTLKYDSTFSHAYIVRAIFEREGAKLTWLEKGIVQIVFGENLSGSLKAAEQNLHLALQYEPDNPFAYYELFWTYRAMKDSVKAIDALQKVIRFVPRNLREKQQQTEAAEYLAALASHTSNKVKR